MERILAVDPGREKCGVALLDEGGKVKWQRVVKAGELLDAVADAVEKEAVSVVVVGDRTGSRDFRRHFAEAGLNTKTRLAVVDEHMSSVEGRRRYLAAHPGRGLARLLPASLRTPGEPFDDYVAVVLAERYVAGFKRKVTN